MPGSLLVLGNNVDIWQVLKDDISKPHKHVNMEHFGFPHSSPRYATRKVVRLISCRKLPGRGSREDVGGVQTGPFLATKVQFTFFPALKLLGCPEIRHVLENSLSVSPSLSLSCTFCDFDCNCVT